MTERSASSPSLERAALVGLVLGSTSRLAAEQSLSELEGLAAAAGATVVLRMLQERPRPEAATFLGRGKVATLAAACAELEIDVVVVDHELTPAQLRQLERTLETKVVDRTQLILDIFARRARTREGKLQVERAQLEYLLPRLAGKGTALSRLGGGIGTRGPGETKLETDRRRIRARIVALEREIDLVRRRRSHLRERRQQGDLPTVALVGYTNAGKTTLFNRLTHAGAIASDALFVTLDPLVRQVKRPGGQAFLLSDTVGFIDRLPHSLVAAFRATLEEVAEADLLLHVIDATSPDRPRHVEAVYSVLGEVGAADVRVLEVYTKADGLSDDDRARLRETRPEAVVVSGRTGEGIEGLLDEVASRTATDVRRVTLRWPADDRGSSRQVAQVYQLGRVFRHESTPDGVEIEADLPRRVASRFARLLAAIVLGVLAASCASAVVPPAPTALAYPEFVFPEAAGQAQSTDAIAVRAAWRSLQAREPDAAERQLRDLLRRRPGWAPAQAALGYVALARGDAAAALPAFDRSLGDGEHASGLVGRGLALLELGREADSLGPFERAVALDPSLGDLERRVNVLRFRQIERLIEDARRAAAAGRRDEAGLAYRAAIVRSPESGFLHHELADVERAAGRRTEALAHYRTATELDPADVEAWIAAGELLEAEGSDAEAAAAYRRALALDARPALVSRLDAIAVRAREAALPAAFKRIPESPVATRSDLAALLGIRAPAALARDAGTPVVVTDVTGHWAEPWITAALRAGVLDAFPNHTFQPGAPVRRLELATAAERVLRASAPGAALQGSFAARPRIADIAAGHPDYPRVALTVAAGLLALRNGRFEPTRPVSGAEASAAIERLQALATGSAPR